MPSYQSVDVFVVDNTALKTPVSGVLVRVFDETNTNFVTQATTDVSGRVGFTLWTQNYNLRFAKVGTHTPQPQVIEVLEPEPGAPLVQEFEAQTTVFTQPIASDPRMCRASGFFRTVSGGPQPGLDLHFAGQFDPVILEGSGVLDTKRTIRTDAEGFVCLDLIRCANYMVYGQGFEDHPRRIRVPDLPSCNLPDLLFPVVGAVTFDPTGPVALSTGQELVIIPAVVDSAGAELTGTAAGDVQWSVSDSAIVSLVVGSSTLTLRGLSPGGSELRASRRRNTVIRIPNTPIQGVPLAVTVS